MTKQIWLALLAFAFLLSFASATNIAACGALNVAGTTYDLTQSVTTTGTCFTLSASQVTLDCHGFSVDGDNSGATDGGVVMSVTLNDTVIKNCNFIDFEGGAVRMAASDNRTQIFDNNYSKNAAGVTTGTFVFAGGITVKELNISRNRVIKTNNGRLANLGTASTLIQIINNTGDIEGTNAAITCTNCDFINIPGNPLYDMRAIGIELINTNHTFINNNTLGNASANLIDMSAASSFNVASNNSLKNTTGTAKAIAVSGANTKFNNFTGNYGFNLSNDFAAVNNGGSNLFSCDFVSNMTNECFDFLGGSVFNNVSFNQCFNGSEFGIVFAGAGTDSNQAIGNNLSNFSMNEIRIDNSDLNNVTSNQVNSSGTDCITMFGGATSNNIVNNTARYCSANGFTVVGATNNVLLNNTAVNASVGFSLQGTGITGLVFNNNS